MVSFLGASGSTVIAAVCGFVAGVVCPGVVRKIRAFVADVDKEAEVIAESLRKRL